ncbi:MAG TPA: asparagine synthase (glutamine-hydrolyzing), partial [Gemmatimonadaceae bacterium]|nr:asparagine synthase (glutamine-hydrolyzing) [Gemmatimonadaceae bacterium]
TRSDTEVLLHLYEDEGPDCLHRLNGQWAFALWDKTARRLLLARDRLGILPLFYTITESGLLFASEIKALLCHPSVPRRIDLGGLDQIFTYWCNVGSRTAFQGIRELPPGCWLTVQDGEITVRRYWSPDFSTADGHSREEYREQLLQLLTDAVRLRLRSDVPVGVYLSGGLDSTITAALVKHRCSDESLRTFSIGFSDPDYDETSYQLEASRFLGTDHCGMACTTADIGRVFPEVVWHAEKPVLRTGPAALLLLSKFARERGCKVVMSGEGADEMFGGYDIFKETKVRRFCAAQPASTLRPKLLGRLYPYIPQIQAQPGVYLGRYFQAEPNELGDPFFSHGPRWRLTAGIKTFLTRDAHSGTTTNGYSDVASDLPPGFSRWDWLARAQYLETTILLPGYILSSQGDRVAMAHGVEGRFPFLDHRVVEFAAALPPRFKLSALREKYLLNWSTRGVIPPSISQRPKQPYRAPETDSFFATRLDYAEELLRPERLREDGIFQPAAVELLVKKVKSGRAVSTRDNMAVTGIVSTQLWIDQFIRNAPGRLPHGPM